jgi:replication initiation protein RepC
MRAHGIAGTTLRRHLAALVDAGLIERRDSPNGKRYAHRGRGGEIEAAYRLQSGTPACSRVPSELAEPRATGRRGAPSSSSAPRKRLSLCRRDVRKLISAAMEEGADGDWATIETMFIGARWPAFHALLAVEDVDAVLEEMELLREEIINRSGNSGKSTKNGRQ